MRHLRAFLYLDAVSESTLAKTKRGCGVVVMQATMTAVMLAAMVAAMLAAMVVVMPAAMHSY